MTRGQGHGQRSSAARLAAASLSVIAAASSFVACSTSAPATDTIGSEPTVSDSSFAPISCVIDERATIVATQYFNALLSPGPTCPAIERVLPSCRATWDEQANRDALTALGIREVDLMDTLEVDEQTDRSASIRVLGTSPDLALVSSWVLDDASGQWMIDTCGERPG